MARMRSMLILPVVLALTSSLQGMAQQGGVSNAPVGAMLNTLLSTGPGSGGYTLPRVRLRDVRFWTYNIQDVNTSRQRNELVGSHFDMYVLEPVVTEKGMSGFDIARLVRDIRNYNIKHYNKNPIILAYIDIGQAEDWRWYWKSGWRVGNPSWIVATDPDGWSGNYPVAYWYQQWQDIVIYGYNGRSHVEESLKAGFDGIYMDWVEAFADTRVAARASNEGVNPVDAMFEFIDRIRNYARTGSSRKKADYLVVAQNASDLYQENPQKYEKVIDAIACEAIWYDGSGGFDNWNDPTGYNVLTTTLYPGWTGEVLAYLNPIRGRLPIFCVEYAQDVGGVNRANRVYTVLAPGRGFIPYCSRRSLARLSTTPYPKNYSPQDY